MPKNRKGKTYKRIGKFSLAQVLSFVITDKDIRNLHKAGVKRNSPEWKEATEKEYKGVKVKMTSQRYRLFAAFGCICVKCGLEGKFFGLEHHSNDTSNSRYHFNLYGFDADGNEVMMTKDHILPKSKGGSNTLDNLQPMCIKCNGKKADQIEEEME